MRTPRRLGYEPHPQLALDAVRHLVCEREQLGRRRAAAVGEREGVLR